MNYPTPTIRINVDVTNPGQFFACCGLLELADRLWPGAEGWFSPDRPDPTWFHVSCQGSLPALITVFKETEITSSLSCDKQKRLATLLSVAKASLSAADLAEKEELQRAWRSEQLYVSAPFDLQLDWWRDGEGNRTELKTWAAKQMVAEMASAMMRTIRADLADASDDDSLFRRVEGNSLPFNFDSDLCRTGNARDAGFSADTLKLKASYRPMLEILALIGLQRFRPVHTETQRHFVYCAWAVPLPVSVAGSAASGNLHLEDGAYYRFELFHRTKYMKAFLPAQPM